MSKDFKKYNCFNCKRKLKENPIIQFRLNLNFCNTCAYGYTDRQPSQRLNK